MKQSYFAAYQHDTLAKNDFPAPAYAYPVRKCLTRKRPDPACQPDPEVDMLKHAVNKVMAETEKKAHSPAAVGQQHKKIKRWTPAEDDCTVRLESKAM